MSKLKIIKLKTLKSNNYKDILSSTSRVSEIIRKSKSKFKSFNDSYQQNNNSGKEQKYKRSRYFNIDSKQDKHLENQLDLRSQLKIEKEKQKQRQIKRQMELKREYEKDLEKQRYIQKEREKEKKRKLISNNQFFNRKCNSKTKIERPKNKLKQPKNIIGLQQSRKNQKITKYFRNPTKKKTLNIVNEKIFTKPQILRFIKVINKLNMSKQKEYINKLNKSQINQILFALKIIKKKSSANKKLLKNILLFYINSNILIV